MSVYKLLRSFERKNQCVHGIWHESASRLCKLPIIKSTINRRPSNNIKNTCKTSLKTRKKFVRAENGATICNINIHFTQTENLLQKLSSAYIITFIQTTNTAIKKKKRRWKSSNFIVFRSESRATFSFYTALELNSSLCLSNATRKIARAQHFKAFLV